MENQHRTIDAASLALAVIAIAACLFVLRGILIPIVLAAFLSILFRPINDVVRRLGGPAWLGLLLVLVISSAALWGVSAVVGIGVQTAIDNAPAYTEKLQRLIASMQTYLAQVPGGIELTHRLEQGLTPQVGVEIVTNWLGSMVGILGDGVMVILYLVFIMLGSDAFPSKLKASVRAAGSAHLLDVYASVNNKVLRYLRVKTLFNLLNASIVYIVLLIFGVDFAPFIAMMALFFNYLPNIGSVFTVVLAGAVSIVQFESPGLALVIVLILTVVGNLVGNVLEPRAMGQSLDLSPVVVLFSLVFWGWMWGIVGMILSVPIMAILKVVMDQYSTTRPISILLGNKAPEATSTA